MSISRISCFVFSFVIFVLGCSSARADGFTVENVFGQGVFYSNATGQSYSPRRTNYVRLLPFTLSWAPQGGPIDQHVTLDPNYYDHAQLQAALQQMKASGYNTIRLSLDCPFLWVTSQNSTTPAVPILNTITTPGIPPLFLKTLEDALSLVGSYNMKAMLADATMPANYLPNESYPSNNVGLGLGPPG